MYFNVKLLLYKTKEQWKVSDGLCTFLFRDGGGGENGGHQHLFATTSYPILQVFHVHMEGKAVAEQIFPI